MQHRWVYVSLVQILWLINFLPALLSYFDAPQHAHHQVVLPQSNINHLNMRVSLPMTFYPSTFDRLKAEYRAV